MNVLLRLITFFHIAALVSPASIAGSSHFSATDGTSPQIHHQDREADHHSSRGLRRGVPIALVEKLPHGAHHSRLRSTLAPAHAPPTPVVVDPEIAEAEAIATQAEAEALGEEPTAVAVAASSLEAHAPKAESVRIDPDVATLATDEVDALGTAQMLAAKADRNGGTAQVLADKIGSRWMPMVGEAPAKPATKVAHPHSTENPLRAMRQLPKRVTEHVGEVAHAATPALPASQEPVKPHTRPYPNGPFHQRHRLQKSEAGAPPGGPPPGITVVDHREAPKYETPAPEDVRNLYAVEPGIAYGHGVPQADDGSSVADKKALDEARRLEEEEAQARRDLQSQAFGGQPSTSSGKKRERFRHEVEDLEARIAKETKSSSLALMLGDLQMDVYQLNEKADMMQKDIKDGVPVDWEGADEDRIVYPLSTAMRCIFLLAAQYFLVYTALAVCKAFTDVFDLGDVTMASTALKAACDAVSYAPMLCVLFLGTHLRASQITLGKRGPQEWAETAMEVCTWSCLVQTCLVLAIGLFSNPKHPLTGQSDAAGLGCFAMLRYASLMGLYAGFTVVCAAVLLMDARSLGARPANIWDDPRTAKTEYAPPVSAAMTCTIFLTLFFFAVHLAHSMVWTCKKLAGKPDWTAANDNTPHGVVSSWEKCLQTCASAVNIAPMICLLFIAARMRALQMDPRWGRPQRWAEACFYICVGSIVGQTFFILFAKIIGGRSAACAQTGNEEGRSTPLQQAVLFLSYVAMAVTYVACGLVVGSMIDIKAQDGAVTPPISPAMKCVMFLVALYFGVNLCVFITQAITEASEQGETFKRITDTCKMAENTTMFGPMLAVLFVAARMRALQMTRQKGSPQCWAQDAMYMAAGAVALQLCMAIVSGALSSSVNVDETGTLATSKIRYLPGRVLMECLKAMTFIMLFGGVLAIVASILVIRPETAQCAKTGFNNFDMDS